MSRASRVQLDDGTVAEIEIEHSKPKETPRTTRVKVVMRRGEETIGEIEKMSRCSPSDNFDKSFGRLQALLRIFDADPDKKLIPRTARSAIFRVVVPRVTPAMKGVHRSRGFEHEMERMAHHGRMS